MNYAEEIKNKLQYSSIEPVYAVIYARVSTDNEGQKESCANQIELAEKYISSHSNIRLVGVYVDDGISGKNDFTRPQYNEMLKKISEGGVDLIITKALSRLNRDQLNSLQLTSLLVEHSATVLTLEDGQVHDFEDMGSELLHSISFAIDAQYVKRQSVNGRKTHELRCARKELSAKDISFGYTWHRDSKTITINEEEAEIVKQMFDDYVFRNATPATLKADLKKKGINISTRSLLHIMEDERYIGNFYINKKSSKLGMGRNKTKKIPLPKEQWILVERPDLQIVDKDIFYMAQKVHKTRITIYDKPDTKVTQARFQGMHKFASKVYCPDCGRAYHFGYSDKYQTVPVYRIKAHSECSNPNYRITEAELEEVVSLSLKKLLSQQEKACEDMKKVLAELIKTAKGEKNDIERLRKLKVAREKQIDNLIDTLMEDGLVGVAKDKIKTKINLLTEEVKQLEKDIELQSNSLPKYSKNFVKEKIEEVNKAFEELKKFDNLERERILNYIHRIEIPANGNINITFRTGNVVSISGDDHFLARLKEKDVGKMGKMLYTDGLYSWPEALKELQNHELHLQ